MENYNQRSRHLCEQYETCECFECTDPRPSMTRPSRYYTSHEFPAPTKYDYSHESPRICRTITFDYPPPPLPVPLTNRERTDLLHSPHDHQKSVSTNQFAGGSTGPKVSVPRKIPSCKTIEKDPNPEDVLFGRGGGTNRHAGNIYFRRIVTEYQSQYVLAKKLEKAALAKEIVRRIHYEGGKFLRFNEKTSVWYEVTDKEAILKASQSLREGAARRLRDTWRAVNGIPSSIVNNPHQLEEDESLWDLDLPRLG